MEWNWIEQRQELKASQAGISYSKIAHSFGVNLHKRQALGTTLYSRNSLEYVRKGIFMAEKTRELA